MKYDIIIENLENIIENWYDKEALKKFIQHPYDGLCNNIRTKELTSFYIPRQVFVDWVYSSGSRDLYPVGGVDEYYDSKEAYSLFNNPKRLHLAVHMLQWFRYHNVEE